MKREQPTFARARVVVTTCLLVVVPAILAGCELGAPSSVEPAEQTTLAEPGAGTHCGAERPGACLVGCGLQTTGLEPFCRDGRWRCDAGVPSTTCPDYSGMCDAQAQCGWGYHCVQSLSHPIPSDAGICRKGTVYRDYALESCGADGLISPADFFGRREAFMGQIVKLSGTIDVDIKCSSNACGEDECCNACVGNYKVMVRDPNAPQQETAVTVSMATLACNGTTCDVSCGPLDVGGSYTLWGVLDTCHGSNRCTMLYMGSCPL